MNLFKGAVPDLSSIITLKQLYLHGIGNAGGKQCGKFPFVHKTTIGGRIACNNSCLCTGESDECGLSGILPAMPYSTMTGGCYFGGNVFTCPLPADAATYCRAECI